MAEITMYYLLRKETLLNHRKELKLSLWAARRKQIHNYNFIIILNPLIAIVLS